MPQKEKKSLVCRPCRLVLDRLHGSLCHRLAGRRGHLVHEALPRVLPLRLGRLRLQLSRSSGGGGKNKGEKRGEKQKKKRKEERERNE
jgi:hypothetical protein